MFSIRATPSAPPIWSRSRITSQPTRIRGWTPDDVSERGEIAIDVSFIMAPTHSQARRLMKLAWYRANPNWIGVFECNLKALAAIGERFVRIVYPLFGINEVFEVQDIRLNIAGWRHPAVRDNHSAVDAIFRL